MSNASPAYLKKVVNPDLARVVLNGIAPYGEFKIFVRLARPDQPPAYMKAVEGSSSDMLKARISCDQMKYTADDNNVLSIELREHQTYCTNL